MYHRKNTSKVRRWRCVESSIFTWSRITSKRMSLRKIVSLSTDNSGHDISETVDANQCRMETSLPVTKQTAKSKWYKNEWYMNIMSVNGLWRKQTYFLFVHSRKGKHTFINITDIWYRLFISFKPKKILV